jgi:pyruvate/2-oxoglutarate/acetoin dehydrogenase E1 component
VCFDYVANEMPKLAYMTNGQLTCPLVIRTGNGAGVRFGAQHSQSIENWTMMIPGLKVVAPSSPVDVIGLMAAAVRDNNPVIFHEHKALYAVKGEVPDGEIVDTLGTAKILRPGRDCTILALALMVPRALEAAGILARDHGIDAEVIDVRSLVPLDTQTMLGSVAKTGRLFTVEENPRLLGWGAEIASIVADEGFWDLDGPIVRITTPHIPLPAADHSRTGAAIRGAHRREDRPRDERLDHGDTHHHAAAGRNGCGRQDPHLVRQGGRCHRARRPAVRGRDRQGDGRGRGDGGRRLERDPRRRWRRGKGRGRGGGDRRRSGAAAGRSGTGGGTPILVFTVISCNNPPCQPLWRARPSRRWQHRLRSMARPRLPMA